MFICLQSKKNIFARDLIEEIAGLAPYELRLVDMMEISEKRSQRFVKKRVCSYIVLLIVSERSYLTMYDNALDEQLGSMRRAKRKLRKLEELKRKIRRREADKKVRYYGVLILFTLFQNDTKIFLLYFQAEADAKQSK